MYEENLEEREKTYESIFENMSITNFGDGISCLRRLEIRFVPLDPKLVSKIFEAL